MSVVCIASDKNCW